MVASTAATPRATTIDELLNEALAVGAVGGPTLAQTPAPAPKQRKPSALDALRKAAGGSATKKKGSTPMVVVPELAQPLKSWAENKRLAETYQALADTFKAQLVSAGRGEQINASRAAGEVLSTVKIASSPDPTATFCNVTVTSRYCKIPNETDAHKARLEQLADVFGDDYPRYFKESLDITVNSEAVNEDFIAGFYTLLSEHYGDDFAKFFVVKQEFLPTKAFHNDYTLKADVQAKAQPFIEDDTLRGYSPSVKE